MSDLPENKTGYLSQQKRQIYLTMGGIVGFIVVVLLIFVYGISKPRIMSDVDLKNNGLYLFESARSFKPFLLTDDNGSEFTQDRFIGKWSLVFFGFTYCPDVCPTTLSLLNRFYEKQKKGKFADDLQIILVSVDPARDTIEKLHQYITFFNPSFIGVTGEFLDIHRFATQLNIPFRKVVNGGENYTIEHSANVAVINDRGHYVGFFKAPTELAKLNITYNSMRLSH